MQLSHFYVDCIADRADLDKLPRVRDAAYRSTDNNGCLKGTRTEVLAQIEDWAFSPDSKPLLWLNGGAGFGKSPIAPSFAKRLFSQGKLGASFFCSRGSDDRRTIKRIFPTIAFQLAYQHRDFRNALVGVLKQDPDAGYDNLSSQVDKLLVEPLRFCTISTIVVIDALDECVDNEPSSVVLGVLSQHIHELSGLRFFITGRPESPIRSGFRLLDQVHAREEIRLQNISSEQVDRDIGLFFQYYLSKLSKTRSDMDLTVPWPADADVKALVRKSDRLFIFASTVVRYIECSYSPLPESLERITALSESTELEGTSGIDALYEEVLKANFEITNASGPMLNRMRLIVATLILLFNPLSVSDLSTLLDIDPTTLLTSMRALHSIFSIPSPQSLADHIFVFHKSFPDFILSPERCRDLRFHVDSAAYHTKLALCCFHVMKRLKKNICNLPPYIMNADVDDLHERRKSNVGDLLEYACRYWAQHVCAARDQSRELLEAVHDFVRHNVLSWLEVASITDSMRDTVHLINNVMSWLRDVSSITLD